MLMGSLGMLGCEAHLPRWQRFRRAHLGPGMGYLWDCWRSARRGSILLPCGLGQAPDPLSPRMRGWMGFPTTFLRGQAPRGARQDPSPLPSILRACPWTGTDSPSAAVPTCQTTTGTRVPVSEPVSSLSDGNNKARGPTFSKHKHLFSLVFFVSCPLRWVQ